MENPKHRLLFLNPPAAQPVFRDCYCSGPTKGAFSIQPLDLLMQSGYFVSDDFHLKFIDAVHARLNPTTTIGIIKNFNPDTILSLVGHTILRNDAGFFRHVKSVLPHTRLYLSGDIARFTPLQAFQEMPETDGLLMDFSSSGLLRHLNGENSPDVLLKNGKKYYQGAKGGSFDYPFPQRDLTDTYTYKLPFFKTPKYYSITTSFGCPYNCAYCNTHLLGYRTRNVDHVIKELYYASALGFKSLFIRDATFFYDRKRTLDLLKAWEKTNLNFQWICFSRPDLIDEEIAKAAARLGCRLIMLGVESFDETCLEDLSRNIGSEGIQKAFLLLRKVGVPTAAQILVGMYRSDRHSPSKISRGDILYENHLKDFLRHIDPDYVSLNVFNSRPGIDGSNMLLNKLHAERDVHEAVADRINRYFYFRTKSIARHISSIRSLDQLIFQIKGAFHLLFRK